MFSVDIVLSLFITLIAVTICVITFNVAAYEKSRDIQISAMVQAGADPIKAACALGDSMGDNPTCIIASLKE